MFVNRTQNSYSADDIWTCTQFTANYSTLQKGSPVDFGFYFFNKTNLPLHTYVSGTYTY